jgi:hypothetical protein
MRWGLNVHPTLLQMAKVIEDEQSDQYGTDVATVVVRLTIQFPSLAEVHRRYDPYFETLRESGDERVDAKRRSFFAAIKKDLESLGRDRRAVVEQPFVEL